MTAIGPVARLSINSITLGGDLETKLRSAKLAVFEGIGIWESDLRGYRGGSNVAKELTASYGMAVPEVFTLRDWRLTSGAAYVEALHRTHALFGLVSQHAYETEIPFLMEMEAGKGNDRRARGKCTAPGFLDKE